MPRDRPAPPPFEPEWLDRSLDRYLTVGLVAMLVLVSGFVAYKVREPSLRADAARSQERSYRVIGADLFATTCSSCHGDAGTGGGAPTLNSKEFLEATTDSQIQNLVAVGIPGTDMSAWGLDQGGTLTTEQIRQISTYLRSLEGAAPSVPDWRHGTKAAAGG
jgi:mono/diheme cytochrome c family protein